jgi:hypothetical protein
MVMRDKLPPLWLTDMSALVKYLRLSHAEQWLHLVLLQPRLKIFGQGKSVYK